MNILNTSKYSVSEFSLKGGLVGVEIQSKEDGIKLFPVEAFELGNFLIDWVREQERFTDTDFCTVSEVGKPLAFGYIDQFTYKICEGGKIIGMVVWNNPSGEWMATIDNIDISVKNRYRNDLFKELQIKYDRIREEE